jgi:hypothetical protein
VGDRYGEAGTLTRLGDAHRAADDPAAARSGWQHALDLLTDLDHPDADAVRGELRELSTPSREAAAAPGSGSEVIGPDPSARLTGAALDG